MKNKLILLLVLVVTTANAQYKIPEIDNSKAISVTQASAIVKAHSLGFINPPSVDLKWQPILTSKSIYIEHEPPNQKIIDSLNEIYFKLKTQQNPVRIAEKTTAVVPAVGANFYGNTNDGHTPLDNSIAISNGGYIVSVSNSKIAYYNSGGSNLYTNSLTSFISSVYTVSDVCDPVVLYDYCADRFILFFQQSPLVSGGKIFICFSKTNNPLGGWWGYYVEGDPTTGTDAFDYPKLSVNDSEVFITGNLYYTSGSGGYHRSVIFQMNKLQGYAGAASVNYVYYPGSSSSISGSPFTLLPLSWGQSNCVTGGMLLVSTLNAGGSSFNVYQIRGNNCCSPTISHWTVPTTTYYPPTNAQQAGTTKTLEVGDCRAMSGFLLNNGTTTTMHFAFNSRSSTTSWDEINYNRINFNALTNVSSSFGLAGYDYAYPAIASFATAPTDNSVMIGFGRSNSSIYPEIRVVNCDNSMNWSSSVLVKPSITYVDYGSGFTERWGDYTGMSRKHNSSSPSVWMSGMFANGSNRWDTWIAEINAGVSIPTQEPQIPSTSSTKISPNPIVDDFNIEFCLTETSDLNISIIDAMGKLVKQLYSGISTSGNRLFSFNKTNLLSGTYVLTIIANGKIIKNEKIIIAN